MEAPEIAPAPTNGPIRREADLSPPFVTPPVDTRSAFRWGDEPVRPVTLTPTQQARRGPSPDNPSVSLKKRLKRAAFFEQRERAVAKGEAVAVSRRAGLPAGLARASEPSATRSNRMIFEPA